MKFALIALGGFTVGLIAAAVTAYVIEREIEQRIGPNLDRLLGELDCT